jgi:hypothetical protein
MRRWIVALMILQVLAPEVSSGLAARTNTDWERLRKLKQGSAIGVLLNDGRYLLGNFVSASDAGMEISIVDSRDPQLSFSQDLDRGTIRRVVQVRSRHLPDNKRWMITGALGGGAIGLGSGAIADGIHVTNYHWLAGGFDGAIAGFFVTCLALAAVGGVGVATGSRQTTVVYESAIDNAHSQPQLVSP